MIQSAFKTWSVCVALAMSALSSGFSQASKIITLDLAEIQNASVDRPGDLYILHKKNQLIKFDTAGNKIQEWKFSQAPTVFEPRDGARMFEFQLSSQRAAFFSGETRQEFTVGQEFAIDPVLACSSGDHNVWIIDRADITLKKISPARSAVLTEVYLKEHLPGKETEIVMIREYQNFLFILEKNTGILIFNSLGKRIRIIPEQNLTYFNFLGEELYYKKDGKLVFYNLFDTSTREEPVDPSCSFALVTDSHKYLVYTNRVEIFSVR